MKRKNPVPEMDRQGERKMKQITGYGGPSQVSQTPWVPSFPDINGGGYGNQRPQPGYLPYGGPAQVSQPPWVPSLPDTKGGGYGNRRRQPAYLPYLCPNIYDIQMGNVPYVPPHIFPPLGGYAHSEDVYANQGPPHLYPPNVHKPQVFLPYLRQAIDGRSVVVNAYDIYPEEIRKYIRQVKESEKFDIDDCPLLHDSGLLLPVLPMNIWRGSTDYEVLLMLAESAITCYNAEHETAYKLVDVEKSNAGDFTFYITFQVKHLKAGDDAPLETFQAAVVHIPWKKKIEVLLCRPKPIKQQN